MLHKNAVLLMSLLTVQNILYRNVNFIVDDLDPLHRIFRASVNIFHSVYRFRNMNRFVYLSFYRNLTVRWSFIT